MPCATGNCHRDNEFPLENFVVFPVELFTQCKALRTAFARGLSEIKPYQPFEGNLMKEVFYNRALRMASCASLTMLMLSSCGGGGSSTDPAATAASGTSATLASNATSQAHASPNGSGGANSTTGTTSTSTGTTSTGTTTTSTGTTSTGTTSTGTTSTSSGTTTTSTGTTTASTAPTPFGQDGSLYNLTFDEEFNSGSLNGAVWNNHIWYDTSNPTMNYTVANGALSIWPQRDASGNFFNRTIDTDGKFYQTYGYFEIEAKLPIGKGTWPAFWLFNHIDNRRPEIDIMEAYAGGGPNSGWSDANLHPTAYGATIWLDANNQGGFKMIQTPDLSAAFHKYAIKWEAGKQTFYFDGNAVYTQTVSMGDPMYIMLDLWFGSASGQPDSTTPTGQGNSYVVNYVRAWQMK